jgi:hypothetical protein
MNALNKLTKHADTRADAPMCWSVIKSSQNGIGNFVEYLIQSNIEITVDSWLLVIKRIRHAIHEYTQFTRFIYLNEG